MSYWFSFFFEEKGRAIFILLWKAIKFINIHEKESLKFWRLNHTHWSLVPKSVSLKLWRQIQNPWSFYCKIRILENLLIIELNLQIWAKNRNRWSFKVKIGKIEALAQSLRNRFGANLESLKFWRHIRIPDVLPPKLKSLKVWRQNRNL